MECLSFWVVFSTAACRTHQAYSLTSDWVRFLSAASRAQDRSQRCFVNLQYAEARRWPTANGGVVGPSHPSDRACPNRVAGGFRACGELRPVLWPLGFGI